MRVRERPCVLLVDDDRSMRDMLTPVLRMHGFDVHVAADGHDALRQMDDETPDVIVLDLDMPRVSGIAVHEEILTRDDFRDIPVIIATGTEWPAPFNAFATLRKPFDTEDL